MNKKLQVFKYITADVFSAVSAWTFFYCFRKLYIESEKYAMTGFYGVYLSFLFSGFSCMSLPVLTGIFIGSRVCAKSDKPFSSL
jgi:hypothetical protein